MRHPKGSIIPIPWSHHEKCHIIDNTIAFMGVLDLCYGRYDTCDHKLFEHKDEDTYYGIDYSNVRIRDFGDVSKYKETNI